MKDDWDIVVMVPDANGSQPIAKGNYAQMKTLLDALRCVGNGTFHLRDSFKNVKDTIRVKN